MREVITLNKELPINGISNYDVVIEELLEREEFDCTANVTCLIVVCPTET